jgi:hypothetical protein
MADLSVPVWASKLTDDDEWVVRTALGNVASDLERVADAAAEVGTTGAAIRESAQRYRDALARIEMAEQEGETGGAA